MLGITFTNISSNQGGSRQPYGSTCCTGCTCEGSHGLCPAEQHGQLPIRHALLLSHAHGLTQVDSQDVLALRDKSKNTNEIFKSELPETQISEFLQKFKEIMTQQALFFNVEMVRECCWMCSLTYLAWRWRPCLFHMMFSHLLPLSAGLKTG